MATNLHKLKLGAEKLEALQNAITAIDGATASIETITPNLSNIDLVADNVPDINAVATNIQDVIDVSANQANINLAVVNEADITTVATDIANVNKVGTNIIDVTTTADKILDVSSVADNMPSILQLTNENTGLATLIDNQTNVDKVAYDIASVVTVATDIVNVNAVADDIANVNTVASNTVNINSVVSNETNINTVVSEIVPNLAEILQADTNASTATSQADRAETEADRAEGYADSIDPIAIQTALNLKADLDSPALVTPTINGIAQSGYTGFKNYIINGGFDVWQRGASFSIASGGLYTADRFFARRSGGETGATVSRNSVTIDGSLYSFEMSRDSGNTSTSLFWASQTIESATASKFKNKEMTISFYARKGNGYTCANNYLNINIQTSSDTNATFINSVGTLSNSTNVISENKTLTSTFEKFTTTFIVPNDCETLLIKFATEDFVGTADDNDFVLIAGVQLEQGSVATPFEQRPYGLELSLCQRYYAEVFGKSTTTRLVGVCCARTTVVAIGSIDGLKALSLKMRETPSVVTTGQLSFLEVNTYIDISSANISLNGVVTGTISGATAGKAGGLYFRNTSESFLALDAEL